MAMRLETHPLETAYAVLNTVSASARPRAHRRQAHRGRRSRRTEGGAPGGIALGSLAALPVPPAAKRRSIRDPAGSQKNRCRPAAHDLQRPGQGAGRAAFENRPGSLAQGTSQTSRMGRRGHSRESDGLRLSRRAPHTPAHHQRAGTHQPGTATTRAWPASSPMPSLPAADFGLARRTRRRARPTRSISTSTRNSSVMTSASEIYRKGGCTILCSSSVPPSS